MLVAEAIHWELFYQSLLILLTRNFLLSLKGLLQCLLAQSLLPLKVLHLSGSVYWPLQLPEHL